jgi:2-isopropylmalate synthase
MARVSIYDTTLRDGTQGEGVSLSLEDKLKIARKLDGLGVDYIEGGWPGANPKDSEFFERAIDLRLSHARLAAFGSTRRADTPASDDATLRQLIGAATPVVTIFGKSWRLHVEQVLRTTMDENLRMIRDSVAFLKQHGREVIYDAEHFFDGYKDDPEYAARTLMAALEGGASWVVLCDTNGGCLVHEVGEITAAVHRQVGAPVGIHTHNDCELAVANSLAAVQAGATQVQGTMNGYGERVGNANLCSIIPNLQVKLGHECLPSAHLGRLTEVSRYIAEVANMAHDSHLPWVGASAFAHKAGMHVNAVMKTARSFEHADPTVVGNRQRILISEQAGRSNVLLKAQQYGIDLSSQSAEVRRVVEELKRLERQGFQFEAAEASFELLMRRALPGYVPPFKLLDFLVLVEKRASADMLAEATVKVQVDDEIMHTAADGNGPVNALDGALRKALRRFYPQLESVELVDYKVRVLDQDQGTAAAVRVSIESRDDAGTWDTVGSSPNIIEASYLALADSLEYALLRHARVNGQPATREGVGTTTRDRS